MLAGVRQTLSSYASAATRIRRKRDKHCLVTQAQTTFAYSDTTIIDEAKNSNFTFSRFSEQRAE
jgi:hypothetical protein